jgi:hypothetical protein
MSITEFPKIFETSNNYKLDIILLKELIIIVEKMIFGNITKFI